MGIPTLDGLGVEGAMMHTLQEHIRIEDVSRSPRPRHGRTAGEPVLSGGRGPVNAAVM